MTMRGYLRTVDLAREAGLSAQQVRNYEAWGFLPKAERSASGYRLYTDQHRQALQTARTLIAGYGWQPARSVMQAVHEGDLDRALVIADTRHAELDRARKEVDRTREALRTLAVHGGLPAQRRSPRPLRIGEAATLVGVRVSALRFWEQQGLLQPERDRESGYRLYDERQVRRLRVVALLRQAGYSVDAIRLVLDDVAAGWPHSALKAVERRREDVAAASRACAQATAALWQYTME